MDSLDAILSYPLFGSAEQQHHVGTAPDVAVRVSGPSSKSGDTVLSCDATNGGGGPVVITVHAHRMRILSQGTAHNRTNVERKDQEARKPVNALGSISPQIGINTYPEPPINCSPDPEVESDEHQTGITMSDAPIAASGRGPSVAHNDFGPIMTASPAPARVPLSGGKILINASGALTGGTTQARVLSAKSPPNPAPGNQACALASPHKISYYHCATQRRANGAARAQIGVYGYIPRWRRDATIPYVVLAESFEKPDHARFTAAGAAEAIAMWKGIGVKFEQVPRNHPATFAIVYLDLPLDNRPDIYAEAFFPQDGPGTLLVYGLALQVANRPCLANLLAHEIGHILGLRHSFAGDICKETGEAKEQGSVLWGARNESSVMNYFTDPKRYSVQEQDLEELRLFYDFTGEKYKGLEICDFTPGSFLFREC